MAISILGAGSWGSALALAMSHIDAVCLWSNSEAQINELIATRRNANYIPPDIKFPANISFTCDLQVACNTELIIIATPIAAMRGILEQIKCLCTKTQTPDIIWVCKGFELGTEQLPHQIVADVLGVEFCRFGAMLGPTFALEVAKSMPTAITLASFDEGFSRKWIEVFKGIPNFRVYANTDLVGAEIGAAVKNIIAIAAGITDGLNLGQNARAALITRSLHELGALIVKLGGKIETLYGLSGIGDLILTCTGSLSRNRQVGVELAKGYKISEIVKNLGHVAEGVSATKVVYTLARQHGMEMPIVEAVYKIIYANADVENVVGLLLKREPRFE